MGSEREQGGLLVPGLFEVGGGGRGGDWVGGVDILGRMGAGERGSNQVITVAPEKVFLIRA